MTIPFQVRISGSRKCDHHVILERDADAKKISKFDSRDCVNYAFLLHIKIYIYILTEDLIGLVR